MSSVSMEMSLQKTGPHERKLMVTVPSEVFEAAYNEELDKISKTMKPPRGFRAGKVPLTMVKKQAGAQARYQVINRLTDDSIRQTIENEKFILAGRPVLDVESAEEGQPLKFSVTFEIYPEVVLKGLNPIALTKPKVTITSNDIDETIHRLRLRSATWNIVEGPAQEGMRVRFTLNGKLKGEEESFEKDANMAMIIGSQEAIPGFEDALVGAVANSKLSFDLPFPEDYFEEKLAGKTAHFELDVLAVESADLPELDEKFIKEVAHVEAGTLEALRETAEKNLNESAKQMISRYMKEDLLEYLLKQHSDLDVPNGLIEQEVAALHHEHAHSHEEGATCGHKEEAERRVKLSLILGQYIRQEEIKLDEAKMYRAAMEMAFRSKDPKGELDNIYKTPRLRNLLASIILEEQAVNHLLDRVQETEEGLSYKELPKKLRG